MKPISPLGYARILCLLALVGVSFLSSAQAAPPPAAFGVWDRGSSFDPKEYPFLKGLAFNQKWADLEKRPGVYDWSALDDAMDAAAKRGQYIYLSLGVGPDAPDWIYGQGVPRVVCKDQKVDSWPAYPFYPSKEYKALLERLVVAFGKRIRSYSPEKQARIAFIQVKSGCTGDECAYKGDATEKKYDLQVKSSAWREFHLWQFGLFTKTFQGVPNQPRIALMFNNVTSDDDESGGKGYDEEWKWVTDNVTGGIAIKLAGSARGHHLSGERTMIEA